LKPANLIPDTLPFGRSFDRPLLLSYCLLPFGKLPVVPADHCFRFFIGGCECLHIGVSVLLQNGGQRIQLFPDRDGIKAWKQKAMELNYYNLGFNTDIFVEHWKPEDGEKADIADIVIRLLKEKYYG
jgi:hypothetical protein